MNYDAGNKITYNTELLKSNLCDYNDAYILATGDIIVHHLLSVSQKLMEQHSMMLKI